MAINIEKTQAYYSQIKNEDLCDCAYCKNYIREIKSSYPDVALYLLGVGIDIEKPFETMPLEPDKIGNIDYIGVQYIVYGCPIDFYKISIGSVNVDLSDIHPTTQISSSSIC